MGITNSNKELSTARIECGDSFQVRLSLTAAPDIVTNPTDIVLILDRSGSMAGSALENLKIGAKAFIDIIDEATDSTQDGQIGSGSRIGIVSFASTATQDTALITDVSDLKEAVDALTASGNTNHADAFTKATELLSTSTNARVMVMFTDGQTTVGLDPSPIAAAARAAGVVIYAIGLSGSSGVDIAALQDWASKPSSAYVAITPNETDLEELFKNLAKNIVKPGATKIVLTDTVSSCFRITDVSLPAKGTASQTAPNRVQWNIDELGVDQSEGAVLEFTVQHIGPCYGELEVNESISYDDAEGKAESKSDYSKYDPYLFDPDNYYKHGKNKMFESWGYTIADSAQLQKEIEDQALENYISGNYTLGKLNETGQRITIPIELNRKNGADIVSFQTGWTILPNGIIKLNTPYGGK